MAEGECLVRERERERAKRIGEDDSVVQALAASFLSILRQHSRLSRASSSRLKGLEARAARKECNRNFWQFSKNLLEDGSSSQTSPSFSASTAHSFFSEVYDSTPHQFECPSWLPSAPPPAHDCIMDMTPVTIEELVRVIKRARPHSSPSPLDRISYLIIKRCPSLLPALLDLFNRVIMEGHVPSSWKRAVIKLIPKPSAQEHPSAPGNFRPIALTSAVSKLLSGVLKDRWLKHLRANKYLNPDLQKAFLPTIPGVVEHQAKLASVISTAHQKKRSLAIAWLDIANAYGSVHHSLIQFCLEHYHAPQEFCQLLNSWYTGLSGSVSSDRWTTDPVPLRTGVYQGDPLSVVIFLTVMNTLSDTLSSRLDLGFSLPQSSVTINHLLYADDACIIGSSPAGCQHLLDIVQLWLDWAQLRAKVPKCRSLILQASSGTRRVDFPLCISGDRIPPVEDGGFKFLGKTIRLHKNNSEARSKLLSSLQRMLSAIDESPLTRQQKLRLFKQGVCPRMSWPLLVESFPETWLERVLQPLATKALKSWAGLARHSNPSILFLPSKRGGLALPSLSGVYRRLQASKMTQLLLSSDPGVRKAAVLQLEVEKKNRRMKFKPASLVESIIQQSSGSSRRAVKGAAKSHLTEEEDNHRHQSLCQLPAQGEMARAWEESSPALWVVAVQTLPPEPMKFALNASLNSLPSNSNLHLWGKRASASCPLCRGSSQSLEHILNNCPKALELRRYSKRHDDVLTVIGNFIRLHLPPNFTITIDLEFESYSFPVHITPTNLRPDIVWWSDVKREVWLVELTISFESRVAVSRERKREKYQDLVEALRGAGYRATLITLEVGSRGMLSVKDLAAISEALCPSKEQLSTLCVQVIRASILGSFRVWASRNHYSDPCSPT